MSHDREAIVQTLKRILGPHYRASGTFGLRWVRWSKPQPSSIVETHGLLTGLGLSDIQIADNVTLLALPADFIKEAYAFLTELGLSKKSVLAFPQLLSLNTSRLRGNYGALCRIGLGNRVVQNPALLYRSPQTIRTNLRFLRSKGLTMDKITSNAALLASSPKTIQEHWGFLRTIGLADGKIATNAHLLQMSPKTIRRNYQDLRRFFDREKIATFAPLLSLRPETIESNVQFLDSLGIDAARYPLACETSTGTKRKKMAWLVRALLQAGSSNSVHEEALQNARRLVKGNPKLLVCSIATLEAMEHKFKAKVK